MAFGLARIEEGRAASPKAGRQAALFGADFASTAMFRTGTKW